MRWRCVVFCTVLLAGGSTLVSPVALAAGSSLTWAAPVRVDSQNSLEVSCPSSALCVAVDDFGEVVTSSNPTGGAAAWTVTPVDGSGTNFHYLTGVSCPSSSLCVAVDDAGNVVTSSNPTGGAAAWTVTPVDSSPHGLNGVSCTSSGLCVAVDGSGKIVTSSNPTGGAAAWTVTNVVDANGLFRVSCPSSGLCVAVDFAGNVITSSNPTGGAAAWTLTKVDGSNFMTGVSCPSSGLCVAVDSIGNVVTSSNPTGGAAAWTVTNVDGTNYMAGVSCPSSGLCVAVGFPGDVVTSSNPTGGAAAWTVTNVDGFNILTGVSCPSSGLCVAVDQVGNVVTGTLAATTTTTAVASLSNPSTVGSSVTYTATVAPTPDGGTVAFTDNAATLTGCAAVAVNTSTGKATCTTSYSVVGSHAIVAGYGGDTNYAASSGSLTQQVNAACLTAASAPATGIASSTNQYSLHNSDGTSWQGIDAANLSLTCTPTANQSLLLTANADLFTANAGFNQDLGIFVSDNGGADQLLAWKESGGFAGTFSPNAAYVQTLYNMTNGHSYVFKLKWKTNKPATGATIYAAAGAGPTYSPTSLVAETFPTGVIPNFAVSTTQYTLPSSDGVTWQVIDPANLRTTLAPVANATAVLGGNADLFTANPGFNQDLGIFVSDNGGADSLVAWKESGGFAGTFSPNAAFVKATYAMTGGHTYAFKLKWKTNKPATGATIFAAAGAGPTYSPTSLLAESIAAGANPYSAVLTNQYTLPNSDGVTWQPIDAALNVTVAPSAGTNSILGANADLWTANPGFNQDIGIFVQVDTGADVLLAWKESGGFAGTYSPNAAFVQTTYRMTAGHTYMFKLKWKTNKNAPGATIFAAAGGGPVYSQTRLTVELTS